MKRIFAIILFVGVYSQTYSQTIDFLDETIYKNRVKLLDEFFDRFNGREFNPQIAPNEADARLKNICFLFNREYLSKDRERLKKEAISFASNVLESEIFINYEDGAWFAKATCVGSLNGAECTFTLYLAVEHRRDDLYKWVITRAVGEIFKLIPSKVSDRIMLMPDEHETKFMSLYRITTQKDDLILNYSQKGFDVDETSVFYALVFYGLLDIDYVKDVEYVFLQVPGYSFTVREIENDTANSGWLIDDLSLMTDEEKVERLNFVHNMHQYEELEEDVVISVPDTIGVNLPDVVVPIEENNIDPTNGSQNQNKD